MRTFTVMLADDEKTLLMGMLQGVPWNDFGFNLVAVADNGQDALELIKEIHPDLLISDIRMPFMDGLELARILRENLVNIKIVLLSGFDDFNYAKKALRYEVSDYLLKPVDLEEFTGLLKRMHDEIENEIETRLSRERQLKLYNDNLPAIQKNMLERLFQINNEDAVIEKSQLEDVGIILPGAFVQVIYAEIPEDSSNSLNTMSVTEIIRDMLNNAGKVYMLKNGAGWLYFICLEKSDDVQLVLKALEEAAVSAKKLFGYAFSCGAGIPVDDIVLAKESYQQAKKAISYNKLQKDDSVTYYNDVLMNDDLHVKEYVDKNYRDPDISIDSICQELHISASHFSKIFKRQTGTSFSIYRAQKRITEAEHLLLTTDLKSREIGELVGYQEPNYFSYVFKKQKNLSPAIFRKQMRNSNA